MVPESALVYLAVQVPPMVAEEQLVVLLVKLSEHVLGLGLGLELALDSLKESALAPALAPDLQLVASALALVLLMALGHHLPVEVHSE
jgi:hypothetical protein